MYEAVRAEHPVVPLKMLFEAYSLVLRRSHPFEAFDCFGFVWLGERPSERIQRLS